MKWRWAWETVCPATTHTLIPTLYPLGECWRSMTWRTTGINVPDGFLFGLGQREELESMSRGYDRRVTGTHGKPIEECCGEMILGDQIPGDQAVAEGTIHSHSALL